METTSFSYKTGPCSDVLIIGGGLAGMYSALAAAESGAAVRILCKSKTGGSGNSVVAMSVHRFAPDAPGLREDYRRRFLASGAGQQDAEIAAFFVDHAAAAMERLRGLGLPLDALDASTRSSVSFLSLADCRSRTAIYSLAFSGWTSSFLRRST